jgi:glycosyltransferase involved in cell wall biosynthesis
MKTMDDAGVQGRTMKTAIVHDWLITYGGAERVLEEMLAVFPEADLFALYDFIPAGRRGFIRHKPVTTSFLQHFPLAKSKYRSYLPLMPLAVEQFDLSGYDLVISSSFAVAKGIITGPDQLHVCMCYSPMRYAWDLTHQYLHESGLTRGPKSWLARYMLHRIRLWDYRTAAGVDSFIAISDYIARRINKVYRRSSTVIYPPVDVETYRPDGPKEDFYLTASRMVPYKKIDTIVEAFATLPDRRLVVIGDGPDMKKIRAKTASNVTLLGYQPPEVLRHYMQKARAFVFAAEEDFGIVSIEAQACGTPVIAFGKGGARETVIDGVTGLFFPQQTPEAVIAALREFEIAGHCFDPDVIRRNALRFSRDRFRMEFSRFMGRAIADFFPSESSPKPPRLVMKRKKEDVLEEVSVSDT